MEGWNDRCSFTVLTEEARGDLADLHPRMPVMLSPDNAREWLDAGQLSHTAVREALEAYKVGREVGKTQGMKERGLYSLWMASRGYGGVGVTPGYFRIIQLLE